jgi:hypothetical protein
MLMKKLPVTIATIGLALALGACASDGLLGGSNETAALPQKPKVDPACAPLAAKIDDLRREGVADRVEQAAAGKGTTVSVKRESLGKIAELNKANADFQQKCSAYTPAPGAAKAATLTPGTTTPPAGATKAVVATAKTAAPKAKAPAAVSDAAEEKKN